MVRIKDIAEACGVSTATVSYIIHGRYDKVSPAVKQKVEAEIERSGYISNQSALSLVSRSSGLIGVAVKNLGEKKNIMSDPYFSIFFSYLEKELRKNDKYIMILLTQSTEELIKDARRWNLDGLILCNHNKNALIEITSEFVKPVVTIDASFVFEYNKLVQIFVDDFYGGYITGQYFAKLGHKKVAMIDDTNYEEERHRWRGFKQAYEDAGITLDETSHFLIDIRPEECEASLERLHDQIMERTAIFCVSDYYALQLIKYLFKHGKNVPNDISVSGYDDIFYSTLCDPELTTVRQDVQLKAASAVKGLMDMIKGKEVNHNVKLPVELITRASCVEI